MNSKGLIILVLFILLVFYFIDLNSASVSHEAPNVALYKISGERVILYSILETIPENGFLIINFTSVYCKPCKNEIPDLLKLTISSSRFRILFIYADKANIAAASASRFSIFDQAYADPLGVVQSKFNVKKYPVTILISKNRRIVGIFEGYSKNNIDSISLFLSRP